MSKFKWGAATASYQIEGHFNEFRTIWDRFAEQEGKVFKNHNGEVACNHLNFYKDDVQLMKELGIDTYRFSISWARIFPKKDQVSQEGLMFYKNLLTELRDNNISSNVTMYHWDMPDWVYEENIGWVHPETVDYFLKYTKLIIDELDDLVDEWATLNEPFCSTYLGYGVGVHAPGHSNLEEFFKSVHNIYLAHAKTVKYYRENYNGKIGIVINMSHIKPLSDSQKDIEASWIHDAMFNKMFMHPVFKGVYPRAMYLLAEKYEIDLDFIKEGDLELISTPLDFLGINYYTHAVIKHGEWAPFFVEEIKTDLPKTDMEWDIAPYGLGEVIKRVRDKYTDIPIYITENGAAFDDVLEDGEVHDQDRIDYLEQHINVVLDMKESHNIQGYFVWSLLDNYEWAFGYSKRFGIVYIDFETLKRVPKDSFNYYKNKITK